jgi:hypothetical protein
MNTQNTNTEKARANSTQQITSGKHSSADVLLYISPVDPNMFGVVPLDGRRSEWYHSPIVAQVAAESMAKQSGGKVIRK